jgi:agmatine/peptidylarginine deiminase
LKYLLTYLLFIAPLFSSDSNVMELPIGLTEEEKGKMHIIEEMGRETDPPLTPIRNIAEFERMQGVLIRYPFGISTSVIKEMAEGVIVYCLVSSGSQNSAYNSMNSAGVNMDNVEFITGSTDSYWTRDYGPWWVVDGNRDISVVDFTYNRPRPNDNQAPSKMGRNPVSSSYQ